MKEMFAVVATVVFLSIGAVSYGLYSQSQKQMPIVEDQNNSSAVRNSDVIAVLAQTPVASSENTAGATAEPQVASANDAKVIVIEVPSEWTLSSSTQDTSQCDPTLEQVIKTYTKGSRTLTVYENASPAGCDNSVIGDVTTTFSYNDNGGIIVQKDSVYTQCTKEQNQTCPKGDGKVTVFVANIDSATNNPVKNPINNMTYSFRIDDASIGPDFNAQVTDMLGILDTLTFAVQ